MRLAIAVDGDMVATAFDFARELLLVENNEKSILSRKTIALPENIVPLQAAYLNDLGIEILICGSISNQLSSMVQFHNIEIVSGIAGSVEMILKEYLNNDKELNQYRLPGFLRIQGRRKQHRKKHGNCCKRGKQ